MGESEDSLAKEYFHKAIAIDASKTWPYIHYAELIQPKWGGNLQLIEDFRKIVPANTITHDIVELKLINDSFVSEENYFNGTMKDLEIKAQGMISSIHTKYSTEETKSVNRFIVYNYMMAISDRLNKPEYLSLYERKVNGYYTLYPYGIIK
jgi:hypothetical protein